MDQPFDLQQLLDATWQRIIAQIELDSTQVETTQANQPEVQTV